MLCFLCVLVRNLEVLLLSISSTSSEVLLNLEVISLQVFITKV